MLEAGDETTEIKWINVKELKTIMKDHPLKFSDVDRAGMKYYLKHIDNQL